MKFRLLYKLMMVVYKKDLDRTKATTKRAMDKLVFKYLTNNGQYRNTETTVCFCKMGRIVMVPLNCDLASLFVTCFSLNIALMYINVQQKVNGYASKVLNYYNVLPFEKVLLFKFSFTTQHLFFKPCLYSITLELRSITYGTL